MQKPDNIRIANVASTLVAAAFASMLWVGVGNAQSPPPAVGQAPVAIGQAPAAVGQVPAASSQAAESATPAAGKPVSYSDDQADRGEKRFKSTCVDCHGDDLRGGLNGGPPLKGVAFDEAFANGSPASGLFGFISTQMPPDSPGQFSPSVYADLMAYILKLNGYQPGAPLPSDSDALDHLIMQK